MLSRRPRRVGRWPATLALDALAVLVFVVAGRASHHHGETAGGVASTLWPFGAGTLAGWALVALVPRFGRGALRSPASIGSGVTVCASTVALGMTLRVVAGQGTAPAFVAVATGFLGAAMVGWRAALALAARGLRR